MQKIKMNGPTWLALATGILAAMDIDINEVIDDAIEESLRTKAESEELLRAAPESRGI